MGLGIGLFFVRRLFHLSQFRHVGGDLASYPLLLIGCEVVAMEGEKGFGGFAILVGADGLWGMSFFEKLGEVGSGWPIVDGAIGVDGEFEIIAPALFEGWKEAIGNITRDLRYRGAIGIEERVGAFIADLAPDAEKLITLPIKDFASCEFDGEVHEAVLGVEVGDLEIRF